MLERVVKQRKHAPVFIVDLAVPRDVEPEAAELDDVFLYSVDDLAEIVKDNLQVRREVRGAGRADDRGPDRAFPALARRPRRSCRPSRRCTAITTTCARPNSSARARCSPAATSPDKVLEALARGLTNKFLHAPLSALNAAGEAERARADRAAPARLPAARAARRRALAADFPPQFRLRGSRHGASLPRFAVPRVIRRQDPAMKSSLRPSSTSSRRGWPN